MAEEVEQGGAIDQIFESLKWNGRYQIISGIIPVFSIMSLAMASMSVVFIGRMVDHRCKTPLSLNVSLGHESYDAVSNSSHAHLNVTYGACGIDVSNGSEVLYSSGCPDGYEYLDPHHISTFVSEWDLVCEKESLSDVSQTVDYFSEMIWATIFTRLSDIYGRKKLFLFTNLTFFIMAFVCCFLPSFALYMGAKFLQTGVGLFANVIMMEMMPTKYRAVPAQIFAYLWPVSLLLLCLVAYLTRVVSWRYTQMTLALFSAHALFQWWLSDESLRWLCVHNKQEEAEKLVRKMARINKVSPNEALSILRNDVFKQEPKSAEMALTKSPDSGDTDQQEASDSLNANCADKYLKAEVGHTNVKLSVFIKNRNLIKIIAISSVTWFTNVLGYDGLLMVSSSLAENIYVSFAIGALLEIPAGIAFHLLVNRVNRRQFILLANISAGVSLVVSAIFLIPYFNENMSYSGWISFGFAMLGRYAVTISFSALMLYTSELFPTSIRSTGDGITSMAAYVAVMISPHSRTLSRHIPWAPSIIFGSLCFITSPLILLLPETKGHELSQTIAEMDRWMKREANKNDKRNELIEST